MGAHSDIQEKRLGAGFYREHTPIETYRLGVRTIYVKRDDLFSQPPAPPLAKLRGIRSLLRTEVDHGNKIVGCFQTKVSNIGHALAAACLEFPGLQSVVVYPHSNGKKLPESVERARLLGAKILPIRPNVLPICHLQSKRLLAEMGGMLLPFGMECGTAVEAVAREAARVPVAVCTDATVIVPCGSGVTLAGVLRGLPTPARRVIGVSCGRSVQKIRKCVRNHAELSEKVQFVGPSMSYYESPRVDCPFPAHPYYDLKAWKFVLDHAEDLQDPVLFWNVGA